MNYTVDYFITKFEAIPDNKFAVYNFRAGSSRCFLGHCMPDCAIEAALRSMNERGVEYKPTPIELETTFSEVYALCSILAPGKPRTGTAMAIDINNGDDPRYQQPTPKQRILAALYDIKKSQEPEVKERIVYVTVDAPVRELQKSELIEN